MLIGKVRRRLIEDCNLLTEMVRLDARISFNEIYFRPKFDTNHKALDNC